MAREFWWPLSCFQQHVKRKAFLKGGEARNEGNSQNLCDGTWLFSLNARDAEASWHVGKRRSEYGVLTRLSRTAPLSLTPM